MSVLLISCQNLIVCSVNEQQNYIWRCNITKNTFGVFVYSKLKYISSILAIEIVLDSTEGAFVVWLHSIAWETNMDRMCTCNILFYVARYAHHVIHQPHHQTFLMHSWLFQGCQQVEKNSVLHHQVTSL